jgi:acyl carrier protein
MRRAERFSGEAELREVGGTMMASMKRPDVERLVRDTVLRVSEQKKRIHPSYQFIGDLGFDSIRIVALSIALEETFERPLLLSDWLSSGPDATRLTVASLYEYVWTVVSLSA